MPTVSGLGTTFNLPNYVGELFSVSPTETPLLSMIGGLNNGKVAKAMLFPCSSWYDLPTASQPAISEQQAASGVTPTAIARSQEVNVAQIFEEIVEISYVKQSSLLLSGLAIPEEPAVVNEFDFQIARKLEKIARDVEYSFINGEFQNPSNASQPFKTRGIIEATKQNSNQTYINAQGNALSYSLMRELLKKMFDAGARFTNPVLFANAYQKQLISEIFGYAPQDRNVGGLNIKQLETDYGNIGVVLNRFVPANTVVIVDVAYCYPVFVEVPNKGYLFYEPLSKTGASEKGMLYGQIGLDYTHGVLHGAIGNLAVE